MPMNRAKIGSPTLEIRYAGTGMMIISCVDNDQEFRNQLLFVSIWLGNGMNFRKLMSTLYRANK